MNEQQERDFELMRESIIFQHKFNDEILKLVKSIFGLIQEQQGSLTEIQVGNFKAEIDKLDVCDGCKGKHCACKGDN